MMRFIATSVLVLLSGIIMIASFELKSWSNGVASNDVQNFIKVNETQLDESLWGKYLGRKLELNMVTSNIFEINLKNVPAGEISSLLEKFQSVRYAQVHKLDLIASQADQMFNISAIVTFN